MTAHDLTDSRIYWLARLERAEATGDRDAIDEARAHLRRLGVIVDRPATHTEGRRHGDH